MDKSECIAYTRAGYLAREVMGKEFKTYGKRKCVETWCAEEDPLAWHMLTEMLMHNFLPSPPLSKVE